jgi:6-phosphogluconate dehydrogenase (decarboxylating)
LDLHQIAEIWRFGSVVRSRRDAPFSDKLLSAMCEQFGGHAVKRVK